ncbi:hypothetical protein FHX42_001693 [Saccharopolyspora lacisalsi]|uniref:Uncharacterized protein n=1 Tax=Halosaccharopolyspora lacisalsi TaxID=1000566 RepID=A0A839DVS6_9PSEU|nr:Imm50 family immunity protein [Halosaccharopolyspora lacisalsi]MBA8824346.1 hypothetical protein [Halosaccharopolyspora lacisalsi]
MVSWMGLVDNSEEVEKRYGEHVPSLAGIDLAEATVHYDGPDATLRFDLPELPDYLPSKWKQQGFNTVQLTIVFTGIFEFSIQGWEGDVIADLWLTEAKSQIRAMVRSSTVNLDMVAGSARLSSLSAYIDSRRSEIDPLYPVKD